MRETLGYPGAGTQIPAPPWNTVKSSLQDARPGHKITTSLWSLNLTVFTEHWLQLPQVLSASSFPSSSVDGAARRGDLSRADQGPPGWSCQLTSSELLLTGQIFTLATSHLDNSAGAKEEERQSES